MDIINLKLITLTGSYGGGGGGGGGDYSSMNPMTGDNYGGGFMDEGGNSASKTVDKKVSSQHR